MTTVNLEYAQDHLVELLDQAANGEAFIIERDGKTPVKLSSIETAPRRSGRRTGFMKGQIKVPDDFDTMGREEIQRLFEHGE
jgi:antitoxin (DNA-binding transcriptional repressor) of toxin-antitoxin stability system